MGSDLLTSTLQEGIALLRFNRPERKNALSIALRDAVSDFLEEIVSDDSIKCVVLLGSGSAFSAGFDLKEFETAFADKDFDALLWASSDRYHKLLLTFPLPIVAGVKGPALGGGFDTAVLADIRIASESASFGHPEVAFADVVYGPLHDLVGGAVARDLCLTGRQVAAVEALRLHLVSEIVPDEMLEARVMEVASYVTRAPRDVLMRTKQKIIRRAAIPFEHTLAL